MPDEIQTGQQGVQPQGEGQQPAAMPTVQEPQVQPQQEDGLPPDASDRTKEQFEKLVKRNKELSEENSQLKKQSPPKPSVLETYMLGIQPPAPQQMPPMAPVAMPPMSNLNQAQVEQVKQSVVDEEGYLNQSELDRRLKIAEEAERQAKIALEEARAAQERIARFEVDNQVKELYREFPELDPSSDNFDPEAYQLVGNELIAQLAMTGKQNGIEAARKMSRYFKKPASQVTPQQQQVLEQRSQATAPNVSGTAAALNAADSDELRKRSFHDQAAMDERIRRAGI